MTASQAAKVLGMTTEGVCYRIRTGKIKAKKVYGKFGGRGFAWNIESLDGQDGNGSTRPNPAALLIKAARDFPKATDETVIAIAAFASVAVKSA
jgi:hypothetical protein